MLKLTEFFLRKPLLANMLTVIVMLAGLISLMRISRATYPEVNFDIIKITTEYPGASAEDVEVNVTNPIEIELESIGDLDHVISISLENLSVIFVMVDLNARNPVRTKDEINRAVDRVTDLPQEVITRPEIHEIKSSNVAVLEVAVLSGKNETPNESLLRKIASDLEEDINEIDGVSTIEKIGYRKREVQIFPTVESLKNNHVALGEIVNAIRDHNVRLSGGNLTSFTNEKKIVTFSQFKKPLDAGEVIVRSNFSGEQIRLEDIATLKDGFADADVLARTNQKNSINLLIRQQTGADIINISENIHKLIKRYQEQVPDGVEVTLVSDFSRYTKSLLGIAENNAIIGFFLVLGCLVLFLTRYTALWTAMGIPVSILAAIACFPAFGIDINFIALMTMVLVIGMLVDDAIVVAESITRHREMGKDPVSAAKEGVREVFWPVCTTIATTMIAFLPMLFMKGLTGRFVQQMPIIVILTLGFSLFEAILILPSHIAHSPVVAPRKINWFETLKKKYACLIFWAIHHRIKTLTAFVLLLFGCIALQQTAIKFVLFPYDDVDVFHVIAELPEGYSQQKTSEKMAEVEKAVASIPDRLMSGYTTRIGHHDTDVYGGTSGLHDNWALTTVYLNPPSVRDKTSEELIVELESRLKSIDGFDKLIVEKFNDGPPVGKPVTVTVISDDDQLRHGFAEEIQDFLKSTPGIKGINVNEKSGKQELLIKPDLSLMAKLGINAREVAEAIRIAFDGIVVTHLTHEGEEIDFRVQLDESNRKHPDVLQSLGIMNPTGQLIPLGSFTRLDPGQGLEAIHHYNGHRAITITADVDESLITPLEANQKIAARFVKKIEGTTGIRLVFGGEEKATEESLESFFQAFVLAIIAIFCILVALFGSFILPFIVMMAIPFGLCGVVIFFYLHGLPLSFLAIVGSLGLVGIVVNDSLVMISHLNDKQKALGALSLDDIVTASTDRFRAVLLTTVTTVAGLLPTIYGIGGYEPFIVPIVLAVAGGLVFATTITLILVPVLYSFVMCGKQTLKCRDK